MMLPDLLKFFGTILITNCHFGGLYPPEFSALATGAVIGNTLFFFCSGYLLYNHNDGNAGRWFLRRYLRIYIPVWIFVLFNALVKQVSVGPGDMVYPSAYWFIQAILVFYPLYYLAERYFPRHFGWVMAAVGVAYAATFAIQDTGTFFVEDVYNRYHIVWFYYFGIMLLGGMIARKGRPADPKYGYNPPLLILSIGLYYGFKALLITGLVPMFLQLLLPLTAFPIAIYACRTAATAAQKMNPHTRIARAIRFIASLTLEIYLVQFLIIGLCTPYSFPKGYLAAIVLILFAAILLNRISGWLREGLYRLMGRKIKRS